MLNDLKEKLLASLPARFSGAGPPGAKRPDAGRSDGGRTDMHMGESGFMRRLIRRKELESVFLFVTAKCNSKCRTCFYASETKKTDDLTFDEIRRISETAPRFDKLWLSGGEPFLREDLAEIIALFHHNNGISVINLPTNGLLMERIDRVVGQLLSSCPEMNIHLNFSLDGLGKTHDRIRGVKDNFKKTTAAMELIERKYGGDGRLHRNVATVVTPDGLDELFDLAVYLFKKFRLATQFFETVRGDPRDPKVKRITRLELETLHARLMPLYASMADRLFDRLPFGARDFAKFYFSAVIRFLYRLQEENVGGPRPWGMACTAGETTLVVDHDGGFRSCEMRPPVGRLQDYDFDLAAAFRSDAMRTEVEAIGGGRKANCWCTHTCWMMSSMKFSPKTMLFDVPKAYVEYRLSRPVPFNPARFDIGEIERRYRVATA